MKLIYLLLLFGCLISAGWAELLLHEGFEGPIFPPAGWTIFTPEPGLGSGTWVLAGNSTNHWAQAHLVSYSTTPYEAYLCTPVYLLQGGDTVTLSFDNQGVAEKYLVIGTPLGGQRYLINTIPPSPPQFKPAHVTGSIIVPGSGSENCYICWYIFVQTPYWLVLEDNVDNVSLTRTSASNQTQIQPSTLGVIKSTYR